MDAELAMKLFVTRWLVLIGLGVVSGLLLNGVSYMMKKQDPAYTGSGFWWIYGLLIAALHTGGFMYHRTFPHWEICVGAGAMIALCATSVVRVMAGWMYVRMVRVYAAAVALLFPLVVWLGAEKCLLGLLDKMRSMSPQ